MDYVATCLASFRAPIKRSYLILESQNAVEKDLIGSTNQAEQPDSKKPKTRKSGQNKQRKQNTAAAHESTANSICHRLASTNACSAQNKICHRSHDLFAKLEELKLSAGGQKISPKTAQHDESNTNSPLSNESTDIPDSMEALRKNSADDRNLGDHNVSSNINQERIVKCPSFSFCGVCPSGINCAYDPLTHVDSLGRNVTAQGQLVTEDLLRRRVRSVEFNENSTVVSVAKLRNLHRKPENGSKNCKDAQDGTPVDMPPTAAESPRADTVVRCLADIPFRDCLAGCQGYLSSDKFCSAESFSPEAEAAQRFYSTEGCVKRSVLMAEPAIRILPGKASEMNVFDGDMDDLSGYRVEDWRSAVGMTGSSGVVESELSQDDKLMHMLKGRLILAPLTTVGNLPFRRLCLSQGCDVTVSEMVLGSALCQLKSSDLALLRRHRDERIFGVQVAGGYSDHMTRVAEIISSCVACDWVDINMGCPLTQLHSRGAGSALMERKKDLKQVLNGMTAVLGKHKLPLTIKCRTGLGDEKRLHNLIPSLFDWGVSGVTLHGRSSKQRYSKEADWTYISQCRKLVPQDKVFVGNGDLYDPHQVAKLWDSSQCTAVMIGRGALMKPWIFKEIHDGRLYDISSNERLDLLRTYCEYGLQHWGCDQKGVETTRRFLLEQLSFLHRYIPVGLLEHLPQKINWRPPGYSGRNDLETLMARSDSESWIQITELILGKRPDNFIFIPKHNSSVA